MYLKALALSLLLRNVGNMGCRGCEVPIANHCYITAIMPQLVCLDNEP